MIFFEVLVFNKQKKKELEVLKEKVKIFLYYFIFKIVIQGLEPFSLSSKNARYLNLTKRNFFGHSFLKHGKKLGRVQIPKIHIVRTYRL